MEKQNDVKNPRLDISGDRREEKIDLKEIKEEYNNGDRVRYHRDSNLRNRG